MFNRKSLYLFLGSATICSLFLNGFFIYVFSISILLILFFNRGLFYTLRANKYILNNQFDKGYQLLTRAYKSRTIPVIVINGFIYLSLKTGKLEIAGEAIDRVLAGAVPYKVKDGQRNMVLSQKALYLWKTGELQAGVDILKELYDNGYKTTAFYANIGCLLFFNKEFDLALTICLEAYEYGPEDKVTLDNLVTIYIELENWEQASKYYYELMDLNPTFPEAFFHGSIIEFHNNEYSKSLELLEKALTLEISEISSITTSDIISLKTKIEAKQ